MTAPAARRRQRGFSLVGAMAGITIMMIMMGAAVPSWRYVMKNMREEELLFRGEQIAVAIERYQQKHGGAPPNSLEDLVKARFLRKAWADPMTRDGKWHFLRPGEVGPMGMRFRGRREKTGPGGELVGGADRRIGGFVGVVSKSTDDSLRIFNGQTTYDQWQFAAGQPRIVGRQRTFGVGPQDKEKVQLGRPGPAQAPEVRPQQPPR